MVKKIFLLFFFVLVISAVKSQQLFSGRGKIIFERKINTYAVIPYVLAGTVEKREEIGAYVNDFKSRNMQFQVDSFQLSFDGDTTFYEPIGVNSNFLHGASIPVADRNKVYADLSARTYFTEKNIYNEIVSIRDSISKVRWKLTDETREIAGYECRRANALLRDSIYVVAFYTDAILTKGGPEQFNGLPGMILGIALPYYHISYFATRIETVPEITPHSFFVRKADISVNTKLAFDRGVKFLEKYKMDNDWIRVFMNL